MTDKNEMKRLSSKYANCDSGNIDIFSVNQELDGGVDWIAKCNNKQFYCEYNIDKEKSSKYSVVMKGQCKKI